MCLHQEVKIALHSPWYHHTYRCDDTGDDVITPIGVMILVSLHYTASGIITPIGVMILVMSSHL